MHDDERSIRPDSNADRPSAADRLPLELLRSRRRELLAELREVDGKIRALEEKTEQPPQRERVAMHVREVLEEQERASASDLVRAVLRRDNRLHAGTVRAYISSLRRDGRLRAVGGRGVPGDPLVLALPEGDAEADAATPSLPTKAVEAPTTASAKPATSEAEIPATVAVGAK